MLSKFGTFLLLCSGLAFLALSFSTNVYGASVTVVPRASPTNPGVQFKNQFGYVNVTLTENYNGFTIYANGTMFFDVSGTTAPRQGTYSFQVNSYGNGSLQLRFKGPQPITVTQTTAALAYSDPFQWQQLIYTASQTSPLVLIYSGPTIARSSFTLAAVLIFGFLAIFFPLTFTVWLIRNQQQGHGDIVLLIKDKKPFVILLVVASLLAIIGVITILLEPLLG